MAEISKAAADFFAVMRTAANDALDDIPEISIGECVAIFGFFAGNILRGYDEAKFAEMQDLMVKNLRAGFMSRDDEPRFNQ